MNGTLTIQGNLAILGDLAQKIEDWFPGALNTAIQPDAWGGWTIDTMTILLERLHPYQLLLASFMARGSGRRSDSEVRDLFAIDGSGLRGQTGAISKHIGNLKAAGIIPDDASYLVKVDRTSQVPMFVTPEELLPILEATLARPGLEKALESARISMNLDER